MTSLNERVDLAKGEFSLHSEGTRLGIIDGVVAFRWLPTTEFEFEGDYSGPALDLTQNQLSLVVEDMNLTVPVQLTNMALGSRLQSVRGVFKEAATTGESSVFDRLVFCLVNFPRFIGAPIKCEAGVCSGRLEATTSRFSIVIDEIIEASQLCDRSQREGGFFVSHVCELKMVQGKVTPHLAKGILQMLHLFLGFIRGAWTGPVFPRGYLTHQQVWAQFANWKIDEPTNVPTWVPQRPDFRDVFDGFAGRWESKHWQEPLQTAIAWYVEANSFRLANEARIVLAQCALELLANIELVEIGKWFAQGDFAKLSAAGRIRALCHHLEIPTEIPQHFADLARLAQSEAFDGPDVIVRVRNALVHAVEKKRRFIQSLSGEQRFRAAQLSLQYLELTLLKLFGYQGKYARRGWTGWKGEDEIFVPWIRTPTR